MGWLVVLFLQFGALPVAKVGATWFLPLCGALFGTGGIVGDGLLRWLVVGSEKLGRAEVSSL